MTLGFLVSRSLRQRPLSSILTAFGVALGVMLVSAILVLRAEVESAFDRPGRGYSLVVGPPKSEPLSLVLNAVFHLGSSTGFVSFDDVRALEADPSVQLAVPCAVGDAFHGFRVVATTPAIFDRAFPHPPGENPGDKFAEGRPFRFDPAKLAEALDDMERAASDRRLGKPRDPDDAHHGHHHEDDLAEAVLGASVARRLGLGLGARIEPTHGVEGGKEHEHDLLWDVVGVLKPTGTPVDRLVLINLDSFYRIEDHATGLIPESGKPGVSSVLVFPKPKFHKANLLARLGRSGSVQVAEVASELRKLFDIVGRFDVVLFVMAVLVIVVAIASVMVAIYNTMNERRREIAIWRALGARAWTVVLAISGEALVISLVGAVFGLIGGHLLLMAAGGWIAEAALITPDPLRFLPEEFLVLVAVTVMGGVAGLVPAAKAYRTDVARNLAPLS